MVRIPLVHQEVKTWSWRTLTRSFLSEVIVLNLGYAVFFPLTMLLSTRLLSQIPHPTSPFFWALISFVAIIAVIILTPLHYWLIRRGDNLRSGIAADKASSRHVLGLRFTWPALLATSATMVAALAVTIWQLD